MITFEDAYKKARELKPNIDACDEYDIGYLFKASVDRFTIGGDGPCIILKETGHAINQTGFYELYAPEFIRELNL